MRHPDDETLLEQSKMSFGEHLEELRSALFKSIVALVFGFILGLICGWWIVDFIQTPLREALTEHYQQRTEEKELARLKRLQDEGFPFEEGFDFEAAAKEFAELQLTPRELYLDRRTIAEFIQEHFPDAANSMDLAPSNSADRPTVSKEDLLLFRVYQPLSADPRLRVIGLSAHEPFMVYLKASLMAGFIFASPFIFFFIWDFVAAGLYRHERRYIYIYLPASLSLFLAGAALAFFVVFDYVLDFLFKFYAWTGTDPNPRLSDWISFVLMLPLGFGISFQLPLVMLLLERLGIVTVQAYLSKWRVAVLIISVISMFLTPADPQSMILMGVPLVALYFGGILLCHLMPRPQPRRDDSEDEPVADASGS